jgi:hypothetical protein
MLPQTQAAGKIAWGSSWAKVDLSFNFCADCARRECAVSAGKVRGEPARPEPRSGKGSRVRVGVGPHSVPAEACADRARRVASDAGDSAGPPNTCGLGVRQTGFGGGQVAAPCPHYQTADMPTGDLCPGVSGGLLPSPRGTVSYMQESTKRS